MRRLLVISTALVLLVAACGDDSPDLDTTGPPDPQAEPIQGAGLYPIADLRFVVRPDGTDADRLEYRLACLGDTATLTGGPAPEVAETMCLGLDDPQIRLLLTEPPIDRLCTEIYGGPETATVTGTLDDDPVDTEIGRNNGCGISNWDLLAAFLPEPG